MDKKKDDGVFIPLKRDLPTAIDPDAVIEIPMKDGRVRHYKPTRRQLKAEYYRSQGYSKRESMRKAGYAMTQATSDQVFSPNLQAYLNIKMKNELRKKGVTEEKIAGKMAEWLDAKKTTITKDGDVIETPDTMAQIKGYDKINEILKLSDDGPAGMSSKRKISIEEWTFGDEKS